MKTILIAGQDASLILTLRQTFTEIGFQVTTARQRNSILLAAADDSPDLILLELDSINAVTIDLVTRIRKTPGAMAASLVIISRDHAPDEIANILDAGADLFMTRPIVVPELVARARALLRRSGPQTVWDAQIILEIDPNQRSVQIDRERSAQLTPVEFDLLSFLVESDEEYHSARSLLKEVWNYPKGSGDTALVRNHIRNLRGKLEDDPERPRIVESMPKRGYRINANVRWAAARNT